MTDDEETTVTPEELAAAKLRWADPQFEPTVKELFSEPIEGNGVLGDVPIVTTPQLPK